MCFSASASFTSGVVLTTIGAIAVKSAKEKKLKPLATIPILFGVQQLAEGFVWLSLSNPDYQGSVQLTSMLFLFFAQVVWPIYVPFSILKAEENQFRRKILLIMQIAGLWTGIWLAYVMFVQPIKVSIVDFHVKYDVEFPGFNLNYQGIPYFLATVVPAFISSVKNMWLFGIGILVALCITEYFYSEYLISVWCFFAASISFILLLIVKK